MRDKEAIDRAEKSLLFLKLLVKKIEEEKEFTFDYAINLPKAMFWVYSHDEAERLKKWIKVNFDARETGTYFPNEGMIVFTFDVPCDIVQMNENPHKRGRK